MIKRFTYYLLGCSLWLYASSCNDDEVAAPPKTSFTVDKKSGLTGEEFTFSVDKVNADNIAVLPYGKENESWGGVSVGSFTEGKATVKFSYDHVGTFQAVVVTNNHTADGKSVKSTVSDPIEIKITSDKSAISEFTFDKISTGTVIDEDAKTITVTVPYGTSLAALKAKFTADPFTKVTVGSTEQKSGETENNFTSDKTYKVTADDGTHSSDYTVHVDVTPIQTDNTLKSFGGKIISKTRKDAVLKSFIDNVNRYVVLYDIQGTPRDAFDSVRVNWATNASFSYLKFGGKKIKQDSIFDLTTSEQVVIVSQDSAVNTPATYKIYAFSAPKITLSFEDLNPVVNGTNDGFAITLKTLKGTDLTDLVATLVEPSPTANVSIDAYEIEDTAGRRTFTSGVTSADYSQDVKFILTVTDKTVVPGGITYEAVYTASALTLQ
jgi:hypothetical protein